MRRLRPWIARLFLRDELAQIELDLDEEFEFHLAMKTDAFVADGMSPEEARATALKCFGDAERFRSAARRDLSDIRERERSMRRLDWLGQDLRDGLRQMSRRPGFTILAVVTLAVGLSTSTAVFTYVEAYSRPFPGADATGLYQVYLSAPEEPFGALSFPDYEDLVDRTRESFPVAGVSAGLFGATIRHDDLAEVGFGEAVTGTFFSLVGVDMALGRGISPEDDRPGADHAAVISYRYWVRRYASDPNVLGRIILLNNEAFTIVGVAGSDFLGSAESFRPEFWIPFEQYMRVYWARSDRRTNREVPGILPILRLADSSTPRQAAGLLGTLAQSLDREAPLAERTRTFSLEPATWISPATRAAEASTTRIMMLAAACLLLLACANVANLVLSAGARRHREMALRSAMGASRWRLIRQLLAESLLLSVLAGGVALIAAGPVGSRLSSYFARPSVWGANVPREIDVDPRVMMFALAVAVLTGVVTGVLPALRAVNRDHASTLKSGGTWGTSGHVGPTSVIPGTGEILVSAQIALTVVLLFVAGLVLRTLASASRVDAGFDVEHTLASYISTSSMGLPVEERHRFFEDLMRRFDELSWVAGSTVAENAPLSGHPSQELRMDNGSDRVLTTVARVWPGYFEVLDMEILRGRSIQAGDTVASRGVVVVNEALANRVAADGRAVGHTLWWPGADGQKDQGFEVIGVVRNARQTSLLDDPEPVAYFSLAAQYSRPGNAFVVKVRGDPAAAVGRMEQELHRVDTRLAIVNIIPYSQVVTGFLYPQRMNAEMFGVISVLGLVLAAAGVFGVVALTVARRRREIGIRVAVGADRWSITRLVMTTVSGPLAVGVLLGLVAAVFATRLVKGILWGVGPTDPVALALGAVVLLGAVALALLVPIRRALRIDPVTSLRAE